ncbi:MAG: glutamine synthetase [Candidatus Levybacteria bacterium]|nr:glutamine synthetase [Candidatus Levybacteria bacterium]
MNNPISSLNNLKNFLEIPYDELEELNLKAKDKRDGVTAPEQEAEYRAYLKKEKRIKAVTLCFSNIEGRLHMLDYDKKFLLENADNLTFDGSSIRGFTAQQESDLRLDVDWTSFFWLPADVFGPGKVIMFADVMNRDKTPYESDFRGMLKQYLKQLKRKQGFTAYASAEIEGFLVDSVDAELQYDANGGFKLISAGGYYHALPLDRLKRFIDASAEAQRAMGYKNEKDHPEVAPSQFELNFSYTDALRAADQIQLYKLVCRQVANNMGMSATFIPKPIANINGSGMHVNFSLAKNGKNIFYKKGGNGDLSPIAWGFITRLLNHASETCLVFSSSVNAYRRLDPHFEAPNQIKVSPIDRGAMIRIPVGNERSARIEVRAVAPDSNPYLVLYTILKTGLEGTPLKKDADKRDRVRFLPGNINDAIRIYKGSEFMAKILGAANKEKYVFWKEQAADRSPRELGSRVKASEIIYHHEVTNQVFWNTF